MDFKKCFAAKFPGANELVFFQLAWQNIIHSCGSYLVVKVTAESIYQMIKNALQFFWKWTIFFYVTSVQEK